MFHMTIIKNSEKNTDFSQRLLINLFCSVWCMTTMRRKLQQFSIYVKNIELFIKCFTLWQVWIRITDRIIVYLQPVLWFFIFHIKQAIKDYLKFHDNISFVSQWDIILSNLNKKIVSLVWMLFHWMFSVSKFLHVV